MHGFVDRNIVTNRARMSSEKQQMLQTFLHTLGLKQSPKFESDLPSQLHGYRLDHDPTKNTLWRLRDSGHSQDRKVYSTRRPCFSILLQHSIVNMPIRVKK